MLFGETISQSIDVADILLVGFTGDVKQAIKISLIRDSFSQVLGIQ